MTNSEKFGPLYQTSLRWARNAQNQEFRRFLIEKIDWNKRLISISGSRGVGKTTLVFQKFANEFLSSPSSAIYASLDDILFATSSIVELAEWVSTLPCQYLILDEVHKYPPKHKEIDWSREIKNVYDRYPDLKIIITGSSNLNLLKGSGDLSRRATDYFLPGMSFREYLEMENVVKMDAFPLSEILIHHSEIALDISSKTKILYHFNNYLRYGYFPFYREEEPQSDTFSYYNKLRKTINQIIEIDIPTVSGNLDYLAINKFKELLMVIASSQPYIINVSKVKTLLNIKDDRTFYNYLEGLTKAEVIIQLYTKTKGNSRVRKPKKIFLNNTNYVYCLDSSNFEYGAIRETFFINQLKNSHTVTAPESGDFLVDNQWLFEIGGKNKNTAQIRNSKFKNYIATDETETGYKNRIPLWLFGFLY